MCMKLNTAQSRACLVAQQMVVAWVLTIPCTAAMGAVAYMIVKAIFV